MRKTVVITLILAGLLTLSVVYIQPIKAEYQGNITINADGSISPSGAPIQQTGNTYSLTSNTDGYISVKKNNIVLTGNTLTLSGGIWLSAVSNVTVKNFVVKGGEQIGEIPRGLFAGIYLSDTSNVVITNNTITEVSDFLAVFEYYEEVAGIIVIGGHLNIFSENDLINNFLGMEFRDTAHNLVVENSILYSSATEKEKGYHDPAGIFFDHSSNNSIYHNNFQISIGGQAGNSFNDSVNIWDNGYPSGGNYWIDYNAKEIDNSGIGNKPYVIDLNNTDRYPLVEPFNRTFAQQATPSKISITSPTNQTYDESNVPLIFSLDVFSSNKSIYWMSYSLDGEGNVTITGNTTLSGLINGVHNVTVFARDEFGNTVASETVWFAVAEASFPTTLVAGVSGASVAIVGLGLLLYFRRRNHRVEARSVKKAS